MVIKKASKNPMKSSLAKRPANRKFRARGSLGAVRISCGIIIAVTQMASPILAGAGMDLDPKKGGRITIGIILARPSKNMFNME